MRCVSYTRTTSCKEDGKIPADIIKQQDQHIQEYLKKQGWTLSAKYCDRKKDTEENTAFEELTKDGIDRKFDMVVVDSIDRCSRTISCADDVLVKTFVPAGIHFAVVQDEFISIGKTKEELYEYIKKGIFEKVQEILDKRKKPRKVRTGKRGLFVKKIFDAETGRKISQRNFKTGETVFLFASGTNQLPRDKSTYISFETVIAEVRKVIQREMELAEQIKKKLSAREAESEKYKWLKQYSQRAWTIFEEMEQVEKERIPLYQNYQTGKINEEEYLERKEEIRDQLSMYDGDFSELMEEVSVIEKAYSNKNEWLETFKKENLPKELQPEHINKWIEKVLIRDFKEVQVCLSKQEWKKYFPAEWMEE